jgi:hypothetical protein
MALKVYPDIIPGYQTWLRPNSVLQPRLMKFSAQFNF